MKNTLNNRHSFALALKLHAIVLYKMACRSSRTSFVLVATSSTSRPVESRGDGFPRTTKPNVNESLYRTSTRACILKKSISGSYQRSASRVLWLLQTRWTSTYFSRSCASPFSRRPRSLKVGIRCLIFRVVSHFRFFISFHRENTRFQRISRDHTM